MNLIFALFMLLLNGVICMDPLDIDILQPLPEEGIETEEVTFYGMNYKIVIPLGQYFFRTVSYNGDLLFQEGPRACMKIVILTGDTLKYIFLNIIREDGENITERYTAFGNVCFLERVAATSTTVNNIIEIMNQQHHSLNNRGFNMPLSNIPFPPVGGPDDDQGPDDDSDDDDGPPPDLGDQPPQFPQPPGDNNDGGNDPDNGENPDQDQGLGGGFQGINQFAQNNDFNPNMQIVPPIQVVEDNIENQADLEVLEDLEEMLGIGVPNNSPFFNPNLGEYVNFGFEPDMDIGENEPGNEFLNQPLFQEDLAEILGDDEEMFDVNIIEIDNDLQVVPQPSVQQENEEDEENGFYDDFDN